MQDFSSPGTTFFYQVQTVQQVHEELFEILLHTANSTAVIAIIIAIGSPFSRLNARSFKENLFLEDTTDNLLDLPHQSCRGFRTDEKEKMNS